MKHKNQLFNQIGNLYTNYFLKGSRKGMFIVLAGMFTSLTFGLQRVEAAEKPLEKESSAYAFDGSISRNVLENYLDRSTTMGYFLVHGTPEGYEFPYREDDLRMIKNMGVKFIGRAIYRWGTGKLVKRS